MTISYSIQLVRGRANSISLPAFRWSFGQRRVYFEAVGLVDSSADR